MQSCVEDFRRATLDIAIVQTGRADAEAYLRAIELHLPKAFTNRVELRDLSLPISSRLPRLIAVVPDVEDSDFDLVSKAMAQVETEGFMLSAGGLPAPPAKYKFPDPDVEPVLPDELAWQVTQSNATTLSADLNETLAQIMDGTPSGEAFPEESYSGEDQKAYLEIVEKLRVAPMVDQGERLTVQDIRDIKPPRRPSAKAAAWKKVLAHLENEVRYYIYAKDWFGDGGHLRNLYRDERVFDHHFMDTVNDRFKLAPDNKEVTFFLDIAMKLMIAATSKIDATYGGPLSVIMGKVWDYTKSQQGAAAQKIKGKIKEIHIGVDASFVVSVKKVEEVHETLCSDWGNLSRFAALYENREITWPKNATKLRAAHALGFQYEAMRILLAIKSRSESGSTGYTNETWGIVGNTKQAGKPAGRKWDPKTFILRTKTYENCKKHYFEEVFLGHQTCPLPPGRPPPPCNPAIPVDLALRKKVYGTDISSDTDPDLGLPNKALDDVKWRRAQGWSLAPHF